MLRAFPFPGRCLRSPVACQGHHSLQMCGTLLEARRGTYPWEKGQGLGLCVLSLAVKAQHCSPSQAPHTTCPWISWALSSALTSSQAESSSAWLWPVFVQHLVSTHPLLTWGRIRGSALSEGFVLTALSVWKEARDHLGGRGWFVADQFRIFFSPALSQGMQTKETFAVAALEAAVFEVLSFICKGWLVYGKTARKQSLA